MIPTTMVTQHPDNACPPYWEKDGDGFISTQEEVLECFSAFKDLEADEYMWDWEGKYADEAVIDKLFTHYHSYFSSHELGKDKYLTFRIPNIWQEKGYSLARAFMAILTAYDFALDLHFHCPPIFEVILPMCDSASKLIHIQNSFTQMAHFKHKIFKNRKNRFDYIQIIPLIEGVNYLNKSKKILKEYVYLHQKEYHKKPKYLRPFIARSDPALNAGLVPAVISAKIALSEYYQFSLESKIPVYPIIGVGSLPFRGGLSPHNLQNFVKEYRGICTVTIQSAFRYDYPIKEVKRALGQIKQLIPKTEPQFFDKRSNRQITEISHIFERHYQRTIESLSSFINRIAFFVPKRRERRLHIGLFGYSRKVGKKRLPRAIDFVASFYSLGIPPEFIGTGRALAELNKDQIKCLEKYYLLLKEDLKMAGRYLNKENLQFLVAESRFWESIQKDIEKIEDFLGEKLGPKNNSDFIHRNDTSNFYFYWHQKQKDLKQLQSEILKAATVRRSLG